MTMRARSLLFCGLVLVVGCNSRLNTASVAGPVTMDGKPLPNVVVSFQPTGAALNPGPGSNARTNEKGEYTLRMIGGGNGAVLGPHVVRVDPVVEANDSPDDRGRPPQVKIPAKY